MEIENNHHRGGDFEYYLSLYQNDPRGLRKKDYDSRILFALQKAQRKGLVNFSRVKRVFDFGSGRGGPTSALKYILLEEAVLEAAEINPARAAEVVHLGIVPRE